MTQNIKFDQLNTSKTSMMTRDFLMGKWKRSTIVLSTTTLMTLMVLNREKGIYVARDEERRWRCRGVVIALFRVHTLALGNGVLKNGDREIIGSLFNGLASINDYSGPHLVLFSIIHTLTLPAPVI
jgi:hypothetical protein